MRKHPREDRKQKTKDGVGQASLQQVQGRLSLASIGRVRTHDPHPSSVKRGMTLTEVVVASAILMVVIVPILKALTIAQTTAIIVERRMQSVVLAQGKLDEIRARCLQSYDDAFNEDSTALGNSYLCSVTDDQNTMLRQIVVSVGFDADSNGQLSGSEVQVTLTTYVAKMGI